MAKTSYEERGAKFARYLFKTIFKGCRTLNQYEDAINKYNRTHTRKLVWKHGASRIAIIRSDYVIKIEYGAGKEWAGGNKSEKEIYDLAVKDKMEHLFAKTTLIKINRRVISIMPKVNHIRNYDRWWEDYCTDAERAWLWNHVADLHRGNVGYKRNKICIVDYAYVA